MVVWIDLHEKDKIAKVTINNLLNNAKSFQLHSYYHQFLRSEAWDQVYQKINVLVLSKQTLKVENITIFGDC